MADETLKELSRKFVVLKAYNLVVTTVKLHDIIKKLVEQMLVYL